MGPVLAGPGGWGVTEATRYRGRSEVQACRMGSRREWACRVTKRYEVWYRRGMFGVDGEVRSVVQVIKPASYEGYDRGVVRVHWPCPMYDLEHMPHSNSLTRPCGWYRAASYLGGSRHRSWG